MKINRNLILSFIGTLLLLTAACSFSASTANVKEAFTAREVNGVPEATTSFTPDEVFYCLVTVANAPDDTVTKAIWYAENADGVDPNTVLQQTEYTGGGEITFNISNNQAWPSGAYKVEIYLDDELKQTLNFSVANNSPAANTTADTIALDKAYMARFVNDEPQQTNVYDGDEIFYCVVELTSAQPETTVKAVWIAVNVPGNDPKSVITETEISGESLMTFNLSYPEAWPAGDYQIQIYIDDVNQGYLDFSVQ
jgi:hypothetical protein